MIPDRYYASSNAGQSYTHLVNRQAFYRHRIIPHILLDTNKRDTKTTIFGHKVSVPIGFAPIGINKIYNPIGELPVAKVAKVAKELKSPLLPPLLPPHSRKYSHRGRRTSQCEDIKLFQLYMPHDDELTISLLQRAHDSGFKACILTLDNWQLASRYHYE